MGERQRIEIVRALLLEPEAADHGRADADDPAKEADAAKALFDQGADVIAQHTDSPAATRPSLVNDSILTVFLSIRVVHALCIKCASNKLP